MEASFQIIACLFCCLVSLLHFSFLPGITQNTLGEHFLAPNSWYVGGEGGLLDRVRQTKFRHVVETVLWKTAFWKTGFRKRYKLGLRKGPDERHGSINPGINQFLNQIINHWISINKQYLIKYKLIQHGPKPPPHAFSNWGGPSLHCLVKSGSCSHNRLFIGIVSTTSYLIPGSETLMG